MNKFGKSFLAAIAAACLFTSFALAEPPSESIIQPVLDAPAGTPQVIATDVAANIIPAAHEAEQIPEESAAPTESKSEPATSAARKPQEKASPVQEAKAAPESKPQPAEKPEPKPQPAEEPEPKAEKPVRAKSPALKAEPKPAKQTLVVQLDPEPAPKFDADRGEAEKPGLVSRVVNATKGMIGRAFSWIGTRYRWGGSSNKGVDCSGLTSLLYKKEGIQLPHNAKQQFKHGKPVPRKQLLPGDLVFFNTRGPLTHVGIYVGEGKFVHAANKRKGVRVDKLDSPYYSKRYAGARRYKDIG